MCSKAASASSEGASDSSGLLEIHSCFFLLTVDRQAASLFIERLAFNPELSCRKRLVATRFPQNTDNFLALHFLQLSRQGCCRIFRRKRCLASARPLAFHFLGGDFVRGGKNSQPLDQVF